MNIELMQSRSFLEKKYQKGIPSQKVGSSCGEARKVVVGGEEPSEAVAFETLMEMNICMSERGKRGNGSLRLGLLARPADLVRLVSAAPSAP